MKINPVIPGGYPISYPPGIRGQKDERAFSLGQVK
jgi:hypothetical protein